MVRAFSPVAVLLAFVAAGAASAQQVDHSRIGASIDEPSLYGAFLAGQGALHSGDSLAGARLLVEAADARPDDQTLRDRAFGASLINGDVTTAARFAPDDEQPTQVLRGLGRLTRAVEALANGRGAEADRLLGGKAMPFPNHIPALLLRPYAAAEAGDWARATAAHDAEGERLVALVDRASRAELLELHGQYAEAETLYRELANDPVAAAIFQVPCGEFLERRGEAKQALALYDEALKSNPNSAALREAKARVERGGKPPTVPELKQAASETLTLAAISMAGQRQSELALIYARLALRLDPASDQAWLIAGDALSAGHEDEAARAAWGKVPPSSGLYVEARARSAYGLEHDGQTQAALAMAEELVRLRPQSPQAALVLADIQRSTDHIAEASKTLDGLVDGAGSADWRVLFMRATVRDRLGRWGEAEADLRRALELSPNEPEVLNYLGYQLIDKGEALQDGLKMVERAVAARPNSGAMQDSLGWAHYRLGEYARAVELLEAAVVLEPSDPAINDHLGDAYWMVGRKDEAGFQWRRTLSLDPEPDLKASATAKLKNGLGPHAQIAGK
jgi:tetratricopeptide (TPR) repeat protein